jgi:hypothetical protein
MEEGGWPEHFTIFNPPFSILAFHPPPGPEQNDFASDP